jgi:hypothetical protein
VAIHLYGLAKPTDEKSRRTARSATDLAMRRDRSPGSRKFYLRKFGLSIACHSVLRRGARAGTSLAATHEPKMLYAAASLDFALT